MTDFQNTTPFGAIMLPSCDRDGRDLLLVVIAARFALPAPNAGQTALRPTEVQEPPPIADEYRGDPANSSLRREGQTAYMRPATDIVVLGHACAPEGRLARQVAVTLRVGACLVRLLVHGNRVWQRSLLGVKPSAAALFDRIPLTWERAFGGVATESTEHRPLFEPRNPVGCGLESSANDAVDRPLPNIEDPAHPVTGLSDRPMPVGVTPVARHWQPRVAYAGTYDENWRRERAPLWPRDFDERFFCASPRELQARPHLQGGERVLLEGLHPAGSMSFYLPSLRFVTRSRFVDRVVRTSPVFDGLLIDTDGMYLTMYFRSAVPAPLSVIKHRETLLRLVEPWEAISAR